MRQPAVKAQHPLKFRQSQKQQAVLFAAGCNRAGNA